MSILQLIAHPDRTGTSFCHQLAAQYRAGAEAAGEVVEVLDIFKLGVDETIARTLAWYQDEKGPTINFVYPCWWEMPPACLVDVLQRTFIKGVAFDFDEELQRMVPKRRICADVITTLGQDKDPSVQYLLDGFEYCGMTGTVIPLKRVGPQMTKDIADSYLSVAFKFGRGLFSITT